MKDFKVALDSGAYSLHTQKFSKKKQVNLREYSSYDFYHSKEFTKFLDGYIEFLHKYKDYLEFYVNLDIIYNPELSWEVQKIMESAGLCPVPVFHYGSDFKWFKKYVDNYEYVAVGGVGDGMSASRFTKFGDKIFSYAYDKIKKKRRTKVHGLAINSIKLLKRYPWYSADASTWAIRSRNGIILIPKIKKREDEYIYDFLVSPLSVPVSSKSKFKTLHYLYKSSFHKEVIDEYLSSCGYIFEDLVDDCQNRAVVDALYFRKVEEALKTWMEEKFGLLDGGNIYFAGFNKQFVFPVMKKMFIRWFGTFYQEKIMKDLLSIKTRRRLNDGKT
jgi:hypothetical protein